LDLQDRVEWRGDVKHEILSKILPRFKLGLALYKPSPYTIQQYGVKTFKIVDYLGAGLPVVMTTVNKVFTAILEARAGAVLSRFDADELAHLITKLLDDQDLYDTAASGTTRALRILNVRTWTEVFDDVLLDDLKNGECGFHIENAQ
jgi:glycosyltransferase involved in cell wall biosynthesis